MKSQKAMCSSETHKLDSPNTGGNPKSGKCIVHSPLKSHPVVKFIPGGELSDLIPNLKKHFSGSTNYLEIRTPIKSIHCFRHPDDIKQIYTSPESSIQKPIFLLPRAKRIMRDGLFTNPGGEKWKVRRRPIQQIFTKSRSAIISEAVFGALDAMIKRWDQEDMARTSIDLDAELRVLTTDYFFRAFFSEVLEIDQLREVASKANFMARHFLDLSPVILPFPNNRKYVKTARWFDNFFHQKLANHIENENLDVVDQLLGLISSDDKGEWDMQTILNELYSLFFGMGNLACALTWSFYCLAKDQISYNSVEKEADSIGLSEKPMVCESAVIAHAFNESARLFPPVWGYARISTQPITIGGRVFPKNSILLPLGFFAQRHPDFWQDPEIFDSGRFALEGDTKIHHFAHYPFGGGPRICVGRHVATFVSQLIIGRVFREYRFELLNHENKGLHDIDLHFGFELAPKESLMFRITKRIKS